MTVNLADSLYLQSVLDPQDLSILRAAGPVNLSEVPTSRIAQATSGSPDLSGRYGLPMPGNPKAVQVNPSNYRVNPRGNFVGDAMLTGAEMYGDLSGQFKDGARQLQSRAGKIVGKGGQRMAGNAMAALGKVPGMARAGQILGVAGPALGAVGGGLAVADLVMGQESGANKAMDAAAMGIGGFLGSVGGPLGTAAGVGVGKFLSDGTQFIFGGGKSAEERKMEEALALLRGGAI